MPAVADGFPSASRTLPAREPVPIVLDFKVIASSVRRRASVVVAGVLAGAALGGAILLLVPPRFDSRAMVLIRTTNVDPAAAVRARMGAVAELLPGALGGASDEELSTELALLSSRATMGAVVDSLKLQIVPRSPGRVAPAALVDSIRLVPARFRPQKVSLRAGSNVLPQGVVWARQPAKVKLLDHEDAVDEMSKRLTVRRVAGNAVEIGYRGRDSITSALVPNLLAGIYMSRRKTVDRGLNQRRLEFLAARADSVHDDLRRSADRLARVAAANGLDMGPDIGTRALAEEMGGLAARLSEIRADEGALDSLVDAARRRGMDARWLAGFPALLRSPALNDIVGQIARLETERTVLLSRVPAVAPQAVALERARDSLAMQLLPIAESYRASLARQRMSLERDLSRARARLALLPAQTAAVTKEQAELARLTQLNVGMGAQVLEARLAALLEGGDVRLIDPAVSPRRVSFPRTLPTLAVCILAGLAAGLLFALVGVKRSGTAVR